MFPNNAVHARGSEKRWNPTTVEANFEHLKIGNRYLKLIFGPPDASGLGDSARN